MSKLTGNDIYATEQLISSYKQKARSANKANKNCEAIRYRKLAEWIENGLKKETRNHFVISELDDMHD